MMRRTIVVCIAALAGAMCVFAGEGSADVKWGTPAAKTSGSQDQTQRRKNEKDRAAARSAKAAGRKFYKRVPGASGGDPDSHLRFDAKLTDGSVAGELVLGQTTLERALWLYSKPRSVNETMEPLRRRPLQIESAIRQEVGAPVAEYTPWRSAYTLFFDEDKRLIAIAGPGDELEGKTFGQILDLYPDLEETLRSSARGSTYEVLADTASHLKLVLVLDQRTEKVLAVGYVYSGKTGD